MTEIKKEVKPEELTDETVEKTTGGRLFSTYYADDIAHEIGQVFEGLKRTDEVTRPCPRCGSWNVANYDPGTFYQMRVYCKECGFYGCRNGDDDEKFGDAIELRLIRRHLMQE